MKSINNNSSEIKYYLFSYTDLFGYQRSKLVPAKAFDLMSINGAGFAGFASWLNMSPADSDLMAIPDLDSAKILPWKKEVMWIACDLFIDDLPLSQSPRFVLKQLIKNSKENNFEMKTGVEAEFFILDEVGTNISDINDQAEKPCYDQMCLMRRYEVITEICNYLDELGWEPYQNDHEDANGQFEINWKYDNCLNTADKHTFFKFLVKSVAERHGFKATFMPKPFKNLTGNGCHIHVSCWENGTNNSLFSSKDKYNLSDFGKSFLSGLLHHAPALSAILNPTVNSYRRTTPSSTRSGSTWAPNTISWTNNNRTHMVRIPEEGRFELRLADGAVNPYLLQASVLASGLLGLEKKYKLPEQLFTDNFKEKNPKINQLPFNLGEALNKLSQDKTFVEKIGKDFVQSFLILKNKEWNHYLSQFSEWELKNTLDI